MLILDGYWKWEDTYVCHIPTSTLLLKATCSPALIYILMYTPRALLRIMAEIDRCPPGKVSIQCRLIFSNTLLLLIYSQLIWFLAPAVALCVQQEASINLHLPAVRTKLLIGSDNMDRWKEQRIWDAVLENVEVVVSTHAVLSDALSHGFVKLGRLVLVIFDEGKLRYLRFITRQRLIASHNTFLILH
jgi:hypothetical protein